METMSVQIGRDQPEEEKPSKDMIIIDQDGSELVKRPRIFAQFMPDIFAVDADGSGDSCLRSR